jgi:hypothetical protein
MSLFDFFKKKQQEDTSPALNDNLVPKDLFLEEKDPNSIEAHVAAGMSTGITAIYEFLQGDYETRGYNDALTNPDDSYKTDNIRLLKQDLLIQIQKANTYYEVIMKELDFHISTRGRAGLIDLVEELKMRKEVVTGYLEKIKSISIEAEQTSGLTERIILSYQRGFMRGLAALTLSNVLNKKL